MNTFLPVPSFKESAIYLDKKRLGQQRREVAQLLDALADPSNGWHNHVAAKMWRGHVNALVAYGLVICEEWIGRGCEDNLYDVILAHKTSEIVQLPRWIGNEAFHASHRGNLLRKFPKWYGAFGWKDSVLLPYLWPTP